MSAVPRVAPRMPWNSESCSENVLFTQLFFFEVGMASRALIFGSHRYKLHSQCVAHASLEVPALRKLLLDRD